MKFIKIKKTIIMILGSLLYTISYLTPKNKKLWVFGAWFGEQYADNSKYLFEYVNKNQTDIRAVWLTKNKEALQLVRNKGYEAYYMYSIKGSVLAMQARVGIVCTSYKDINIFFTSRMKFVQLWHGTPLKKIMCDNKISFRHIGKTKEFFKRILFPFTKEVYNIIISPSEEVSIKFESAFKAKADNIAITGYPRNDALFLENVNVPIYAKISDLKRKNYKTGIYMPTHRSEGKYDILNVFGENIDYINTCLKELNTILLIKVHFYHLKELKNININFSNIIFINDDDIEQDIYTILGQTDFLITDYSSILFDYLLMDKPIIFAPFDKADYLKNDREFYYDYDLVTPGPKATNWEKVIENLKNIINNQDQYREARAAIRKKFNAYNDGNSCERVFKVIKSII